MGADLVWSRYNAMVVAATVLLGFIAQDEVPCLLKIYGAVMGVVATVLWWLLTSFGWSLLHAEGVKQSYTDWRSKFLLGKLQDPIWWSAHFMIWLFYLAYAKLLLFYLREQDPSSALTRPLGAAMFAVFIALLAYTLWKLNIRKYEVLQQK